jgi:hypothetical protein
VCFFHKLKLDTCSPFIAHLRKKGKSSIPGRFFDYMQDNCLLEKLDRVFTSSNLTLAFPNTMVYTLAYEVSDHVPYDFRFEHYWVSHPNFLSTVEYFWTLPVHRETIV